MYDYQIEIVRMFARYFEDSKLFIDSELTHFKKDKELQEICPVLDTPIVMLGLLGL